jgi:hypothetical protein
MQHHASSTHWEEVPCALTDYVKMLAPSHVVSFICGHVPSDHVRASPIYSGDDAHPFLSGSVEAGVSEIVSEITRALS